MNFGFSIYGAWWFSLIYLIFAYGLWFIFPKYVLIRFSKVPYIRYITQIYKYSYILILLLTIFVPFKFGILFYIGVISYTFGLSIYIIAIFYFSINEVNLPVTSGIFKYLRHPVYIGFFIICVGISLLSAHILILILSLINAYCSYRIALEEENECMKLYGQEYINYKNSSVFFIAKK